VSVTDLQMDALSDLVTKEMSVEIFRVATALSEKGGVSENKRDKRRYDE
jgi:hypothetical protein